MFDLVMRVLAGIAGVAFVTGGIYLLVAAANTSGIGLFGSFFGFFGLGSLGLGVIFSITAMKPAK
jgi:uncharacterized membrane protein